MARNASPRREALGFGRIVAASIDESCVDGLPAEQYGRLAPVFFLEPRAYARPAPVRRV